MDPADVLGVGLGDARTLSLIAPSPFETRATHCRKSATSSTTIGSRLLVVLRSGLATTCTVCSNEASGGGSSWVESRPLDIRKAGSEAAAIPQTAPESPIRRRPCRMSNASCARCQSGQLSVSSRLVRVRCSRPGMLGARNLDCESHGTELRRAFGDDAGRGCVWRVTGAELQQTSSTSSQSTDARTREAKP